MEIISIHGSSGMIRGGTNTGVYRFANDEALLIDVGHTVGRGNRMAKFLQKNGMVPHFAFVTHEHYDHLEAFAGLKEEVPSCRLIAHPVAKPYIENLYLGMAYLYSSAPTSFFGRRSNGLSGNTPGRSRFEVDIEASERLILNGEQFEIVHLPGHCPGQSVLITPDKVAYFGDLLMDHRIIDTYDMPYLFSAELQEQSLKRLWDLDFQYGLIGHCKTFYIREEILEVAQRNLDVMAEYERDILALLETPKTREEILAELLIQRNIDCDFSTYHYNNSTVGAFLAKLSNAQRIHFRYHNGKIFYLIGGDNGI